MLGISGVHVAANECDACHGSVEVLVLELADFATVHGVCPVCAKERHVEFVGTLSDFFVGVEGYAYFSVLDFGMSLQVVDCRYDFGDAGFVVGAEESIAVGDDEVVSHIVEQFGEFSR